MASQKPEKYDRDEYGRALVPDRDVPPVGIGFAIWRNRITAPDAPYAGNSVTLLEREHDRLCVSGWIPSEDWWLHCSRCRPYDKEGIETAASARPAASVTPSPTSKGTRRET